MLDRIVIQKKKDLGHRKRIVPFSLLEKRLAQQPPPRDLALALRQDGIRLIAEVKRASPSHGVFNPRLQPVDLARTYARGGAAAISVLTDERFFQGSIDHLAAIRKEVDLPLLRKDFILDPYQVYESRACGADALLLIVAILTQKELENLLTLSHHLGLKCLVEAHSESEVARAVDSGAEIIGINNRDLNTFTVDLDTCLRLRPLISPPRVVVAESGIKTRSDIDKLKEFGINAVLVGEALIAAPDIPNKMQELLA